METTSISRYYDCLAIPVHDKTSPNKTRPSEDNKEKRQDNINKIDKKRQGKRK